jgi:DNA-binding FadR family transcriptional regulator
MARGHLWSTTRLPELTQRGPARLSQPRLAALQAPLVDASELMGLAGKLWAAGRPTMRRPFSPLDIPFHRMVLSSSGNEMFAAR